MMNEKMKAREEVEKGGDGEQVQAQTQPSSQTVPQHQTEQPAAENIYKMDQRPPDQTFQAQEPNETFQAPQAQQPQRSPQQRVQSIIDPSMTIYNRNRDKD